MEQQKNVLITGASRGIGRAIATRLTHDGYRVINLDKVAPLSLLEGEEFHQIDITQSDLLTSLLQEITARTTVLRLVNNAGIIKPGALEDVSAADFDAVYTLNLKAPMVLAQQLLPQMRASNSHVIQALSQTVPLPERLVYELSKDS